MPTYHETNYKEVYFDKYCKTCAYCDVLDKCDPCNDCLDYGVNENSHKPVNWKEKDNSKSEKSV